MTSDDLDYQTLHDRAHPDPDRLAAIASACSALVRRSLVRRAIVARMIALGIEPDEGSVGRIADEAARPISPRKMTKSWRRETDHYEARRLPATHQILGCSSAVPMALLMRAYADGGPCPGCGGRRLTTDQACVICHRAGLDHLLPLNPATPPNPPKEDEGRREIQRRGR